MMEWVARVATEGKRVQVEAMIRKHTAVRFSNEGKCRCNRPKGECYCNLAKRWDSKQQFEDLTFGDKQDDPAPMLRKMATVKMKAAKFIATRRAVPEMGQSNEELNGEITVHAKSTNAKVHPE